MEKGRMLFDRLASIFFILLGLLSIYEAYRLYPMRMQSQSLVGDDTLPLLLGIILIGLGVLLYFLKFPKFEVEMPPKSIFKIMISVILLLFVYCILIYIIGYILSTFIVSFALFKVMGTYKWYINLLSSSILTIFNYVVFIKWLTIPFPVGSLMYLIQ